MAMASLPETGATETSISYVFASELVAMVYLPVTRMFTNTNVSEAFASEPMATAPPPAVGILSLYAFPILFPLSH